MREDLISRRYIQLQYYWQAIACDFIEETEDDIIYHKEYYLFSALANMCKNRIFVRQEMSISCYSHYDYNVEDDYKQNGRRCGPGQCIIDFDPTSECECW